MQYKADSANEGSIVAVRLLLNWQWSASQMFDGRMMLRVTNGEQLPGKRGRGRGRGRREEGLQQGRYLSISL